MSKRGRSKERSQLRRINPRAAGIDIGSASHWVAIDPSLTEQPVRGFAAYTSDLQALADWLVGDGVQTVGGGSAGGDWVPLFGGVGGGGVWGGLGGGGGG